MIDWNDTTLPNPAAITVKNLSQNIRKKTESGRTLQRARWSTPLEEGTVTFSFLKEQFQIFKGVWKHYLRNGNDWFFIDLPVGGAQVLTQCQVRFVSDFTYKYRNIGSVAVQAKIEFYEVETINELELLNLIDVGELTPTDELDTVVLQFVNRKDLSSATRLAAAIRKLQNNVGPVAFQFWDGTIGFSSNGSLPTKTLPVTDQEEIFTVNAYANLSTQDPTPNPSVIFEYAALGGSNLLYGFDPRANFPKHYWRKLEFTGCGRWEMPEADNTLIYPIKPNFVSARFISCHKMNNLIFELENDAQFTVEFPTQYGLEVSSNLTLDNFQIIAAPNGSKARIMNIYMNNNDALPTIDLSELIFYNESPTTLSPRLDISNSGVLTSVTINGCEAVGDDAGRGYIRLDNNNSLSSLTIVGNPYQFKGTSDFRNSSFNIAALKAVVDKLRADSTNVPNNFIQISGNPCWQSNALFPARSRVDISISSITSTATDFTVTTFSTHGFSVGDYTVIAGATVSDYDGLHTVASRTTTTYTVTSSINAGTSGYGGTKSQEAEQDTCYVEERALANNFTWIA